MYQLSASLHPTSLAIVLELLFQHEVDPAELTKCGGAKALGRFRGPGTQLVGDIGPPLQVPTRSLSQPAGTQLAGAIGSPLHHVPPVASVARARS
eukprot:jgi/Tetstr1/426044/TSEL_016388.t1